MNNNQQEEKVEYFEGTYVGKMFKGQGVYKSGPKQGQQWKKYRIMFSDPNSEYEKGFSIFTPTGGKSMQVEQLEEGMNYTVAWKMHYFTMQDGSQGKQRQAFFVGHPETKGQNQDGSPANQPNFNNNMPQTSNNTATGTFTQNSTVSTQQPQSASKTLNFGQNNVVDPKTKWLNEFEDLVNNQKQEFLDSPPGQDPQMFIDWVRTQPGLPDTVTDVDLGNLYNILTR